MDVALQIGEGLPHVYPIMLGTPEAAKATERIGKFLRAGGWLAGQVALHRRGNGGRYVIGRHRSQRLEAQDVSAQAQAEQLRRDERPTLGRPLIAEGGDRLGDQLAEYGMELLGDGLAGGAGPEHGGHLVLVVGILQAPRPHNLPVGIVGSATATSGVEHALDSALPGAINWRSYPSAAGARTGIMQDAAEPASRPIIVTGRSHHAPHRILGSVPVELLHQSPFPILTIS